MKKADEIRQAELRGYSRGYQAGSKKKKNDRAAQSEKRRLDANWNRAFLAALPALISSDNWQLEGKAATKLSQRVELARRAANRAMEYMR